MRVCVGRELTELDVDELDLVVARYERTIVDLATGDGSVVIRSARNHPSALVIGVDTEASGLREASRRAARPARKGGLPNALFLVGDRQPRSLFCGAALTSCGSPCPGAPCSGWCWTVSGTSRMP